MAPEVINTFETVKVIGHMPKPEYPADDIGFDVLEVKSDFMPQLKEIILVEKDHENEYSQKYQADDVGALVIYPDEPDAEGKVHLDLEVLYTKPIDARVLRTFAKSAIQIAENEVNVPEESIIVDVHDHRVAEIIEPLGSFVVHESVKSEIQLAQAA